MSPRDTMRCRHAMLLVTALCAACSAPPRRWPFPPVDAPGDREVLETLRRRASGTRSLHAVLEMSFESRERSGVFEAVVQFAEPGRLRMTAFKDLLISSRPVFDLALDGGRYAIVLAGEGEPERAAGPLDELPRRYPGFRAIWGLREAMFLPGAGAGEDSAIVERDAGGIRVQGHAPSGLEVEWTLEPQTLGVVAARLRFPDGQALVTYESYREEAGRFFPEAFELRDATAGVVVRGVLLELEVDPSLAEDAFSIEAARGGGE